MWAFHTEKQVGQISEYFPVEKFGILWKVKIKQSRGRWDQSPAALGQSVGLLLKWQTDQKFQTHIHSKATFWLCSLSRYYSATKKITFTKMTLKIINHDKTFFCYLVYIKMWNCVWLELKLHAALNPYYQHDTRRHELTHENFIY